MKKNHQIRTISEKMSPLRRLMEIVRAGGTLYLCWNWIVYKCSKIFEISTTCKEHHDPHVEVSSSNYEVWKKIYGTLKSPSNEIGPKLKPKLKLSGNSKNSPKIQSFIIFWSEKTIGSISQKHPGSSHRKFGLLWNNLIQFSLFYLQKPHGGLTVL
jgi:hypothetical protein